APAVGHVKRQVDFVGRALVGAGSALDAQVVGAVGDFLVLAQDGAGVGGRRVVGLPVVAQPVRDLFEVRPVGNADRPQVLKGVGVAVAELDVRVALAAADDARLGAHRLAMHPAYLALVALGICHYGSPAMTIATPPAVPSSEPP